MKDTKKESIMEMYNKLCKLKKEGNLFKNNI